MVFHSAIAPFLVFKTQNFLVHIYHSRFTLSKNAIVLKRAFYLRFRVFLRLRPSVQYAPCHGNTGGHFTVFLSGHLHKFDITCAAQNSWQNSHSDSCAGHMTFCLDAHVRKTKKRCPRCFCGTDILSGLSNLRKTGNIDIVESSFLGICAFLNIK